MNRFAEWLHGHVSGLSHTAVKIIFSLIFFGAIYSLFFFMILLFFQLKITFTLLLAFPATVLSFFLPKLFHRSLYSFASIFEFMIYGKQIDRTHEPDFTKAEKLKANFMYPEAIKEYRMLFSRFPERLDILFEIGEIYRNELKNVERALKTYKSLLTHPEDGEYGVYVHHARQMILALETPEAEPPELITLDGTD